MALRVCRSTPLLTLAAALCLAPAAARPESLAVPRTAAKLTAFVPAGWPVESKLEGELDGDGRADTVLVLLQKPQPDEGDRQRALVVLRRRGAGWEVAGTNVGLVQGWQMGGVKGGDAAPTLSITGKRVLVVEQWGGSRWTYGFTHRFRWSRERARLELIGVDKSDMDTLGGASSESSCNLLTGVCVEKKTPGQEDEEGNPVEGAPAPTEETRKVGKKPLPALEDVTLEE